MEAIFKDYGVKFELPKDVLYYNKKEFLSHYGFSKEQQESCLMVLRKNKTDVFTIVSYMGEVENEEVYKKLLRDYVDINESNNLSLTYKNKIVSNDGRELYIYNFSGLGLEAVTIFSLLNNSVFYSVANCKKEKLKEFFEFSVRVMQGIFPEN